jgi:hypothetical protein
MQKPESRAQLLTLYKDNLKWIKDLNVRSNIVNVLYGKAL